MLILAFVVGPTSLIGLAAWRRFPELWGAAVGLLATAFGIVFCIPIRFAIWPPSGMKMDGVECFVIIGSLAVVHLALFFTIGLLLIEKLLEQRKSAKPRVGDEVASNS